MRDLEAVAREACPVRARDAAGRWLHPDGLCWPACKEILAALEAERRATVKACANAVAAIGLAPSAGEQDMQREAARTIRALAPEGA